MTATRRELKRFIKELAKIRGRHTELVSVYVPAGYDIIKIIQHLQEEQGTAKNIKDAKTRGNVIDSLERCIRHLRLFKQTPLNGLAIFAGNVAAQEGKSDIQVWSIEPPEPLSVRLYRCDQTFVIDLLRDMMESTEVYGLIVMDRREATLGFLRGTLIQKATHLTSGVPGKIKAGGQCHALGTLVQCSDGSILKIEDCHNPLSVKSADFKHMTLLDSPITDRWFVNKSSVYTITTKHPRMVLECSGDHLLFVHTPEGIAEKPVKELKVSDTLLMPEQISIKGKKQLLDPKKYYNSFVISKAGQNILRQKRTSLGLHQSQLGKKLGLSQMTFSCYETGKQHAGRDTLRMVCEGLGIDFAAFIQRYTEPYKYREISLPSMVDNTLAQFIGYFIGDGSAEKDRITFFEQNKEVALEYQKKFGSYFHIQPSYKYRISKNYYQLRFTSRPLVRFILQEFPEAKKTNDFSVPLKILQSPPDAAAGFLRGIFDAEGFVHTTNNHGVGIALINKTFIQQLQLLLLRFSIISSFYAYDNKKNPYSKKPIFKLQITDKESLIHYRELIGFTSEKKSTLLNQLISRKTDKSQSRQILATGSSIRSMIYDSGQNMQAFPRVSNFFYDERNMGKPTFRRSILSFVKDKSLYNNLKRIYDCALLPVSIHEIKKTKKKTSMVDISVLNQNFIANGLVSHNSARRYERIREGMAIEFYKRISEACSKEFLDKIVKKELKGILLGGPGPTKEEFKDYLTADIQNAIIAIQDLTYTDETGLQHLVERSKDVLAKEAYAEEMKLLQEFFERLAKGDRIFYKEAAVRKALDYGAVETLLLSEALDDDLIDSLEQDALNYGTTVRIVSIDTTEGKQFRDLGGFGALLRYHLEL